MPEGPEVKTIGDQLRTLVNKGILKNIQYDSRAKQKDLDKLITPAKVLDVTTHGKRLFIHLNTNQIIMISFGMEGHLFLSPGTHTHVTFVFNNANVYFDDSRYFGSVRLFTTLQEYDTFLNTLGYDPLSEDKITLDEFKSFFGGKRQICVVLMDQSLIAGIGNYLKSEILYYAGIRPCRTVNTLTDDEIKELFKYVKSIPKKAYEAGGLTLRSYGDLHGEPGGFKPKVYGQTHDPDGNEVKTCQCKDGRTSYYVPAVQT